jgi:hypothetical protein
MKSRGVNNNELGIGCFCGVEFGAKFCPGKQMRKSSQIYLTYAQPSDVFRDSLVMVYVQWVSHILVHNYFK